MYAKCKVSTSCDLEEQTRCHNQKQQSTKQVLTLLSLRILHMLPDFFLQLRCWDGIFCTNNVGHVLDKVVNQPSVDRQQGFSSAQQAMYDKQANNSITAESYLQKFLVVLTF